MGSEFSPRRVGGRPRGDRDPGALPPVALWARTIGLEELTAVLPRPSGTS
jgi:hypothetical protein